MQISMEAVDDKGLNGKTSHTRRSNMCHRLSTTLAKKDLALVKLEKLRSKWEEPSIGVCSLHLLGENFVIHLTLLDNL